MKNKGIEELEKRAETGDVLALFELGEKYHTGDGIKIDEEKAFSYYEKSAEAGNPRAQYIVGKYFEDGKYVEKNLEAANKWFEKAAKHNNADALFQLAQNYSTGRGCDSDDKKALDLYSKAANLGHAKAQYELAEMYKFGLGCDEDEEIAVKWYTESASQGNLDAQEELGDIYYKGSVGIEKNLEKAFELYKKYVDQGGWNGSVKNRLADMYYYGQGCEQNDIKAFELYKEAGRFDHYAMYSLGWMYEHGQGTKQDFTAAKRFYHTAAEQGDSNALYRLALFNHYFDPELGLYRHNLSKAKEYYEKAIANGYEDKDRNLDKLKKEMETYFVIEGTVSECSVNKTFDFVESEENENAIRKDKISFSFSITGSEGYSVKQENNNLNIFCLQSGENNQIEESYIVKRELKYNVSTEFSAVLVHAVNHHKKIRFVISKTELEALSESNNNSKELDDITISLLQD